MRILCIPDIHGRDFWIEPCQKWEGPIVFLGDYHDPYPFQVSKDKSLQNLEKLVDFVIANKSRCTCLEGNHDYPYLTYANNGCRFDKVHANLVRERLVYLDLHLTLIKDDVIFSHAGVTPAWCDSSRYSLNQLLNNKIPIRDSELERVSWYRGGEDKYGSPLWCDVSEYANLSHFEGFYQVFGHSQQEKNPIINEDFACLDCRKCFIVDTETKEIIPYE